jgi:hypothetical protein
MLSKVHIRRPFDNIHQLFLTLTITIAGFPWIAACYGVLIHDRYLFPTFSGDGTHYLARAKQYWLGKSPTNLVSGSSHKEDGFGNAAEYILLPLGKLFQSNNKAFALTISLIAFVGSVLGVLTFYYLLRKLEFTEIRASIGAIFTVLLSDLLPLHSGSLQTFTTSFFISRWPTPSFHYVLINLLLLYMLARLTLRRIIILIVVFSLSFYLYFYTWQVLVSILLVWQLKVIFERDWRIFAKINTVFLLGLILAWPIISKLIGHSGQLNSIEYQFFIHTTGYREVRTVNFASLTLLLGILIFMTMVTGLSSQYSKNQVFIIRLIFLSSLIIQSQSLISGREVQPGHYYWYFEKPYAFFCIYILLNKFWRKYDLQVQSLVLCLLSIFVLMNIQNPAVGEKAFKEMPSLSTINRLGNHAITFDNSLIQYWAVNSNTSPLPVMHMVYYPDSLDESMRFCAANSVWNSGQMFTDVFKNLEDCPVSNELIGFFGDINVFYQAVIDSAGNQPSLFFSKWLKEYKIDTIVSISAPLPEQMILLSNSDFVRDTNFKDMFVFHYLGAITSQED